MSTPTARLATDRITEIRQRNAALDRAPHIRDDVAVLLAEVEQLTIERDQAGAALQRVRDLHPKIEDPRHGCCAPPKLCDGHEPECRSSEHPLGGVRWPCATLRAIGEVGAEEAHRCPYPAAGCTSPLCNISAARGEQRAYERGHRDAAEKAAAEITLRDRVLAGLDDRASMWEAEMAAGSLTNAPWAVSELRDGLAEWVNGREGE